MVCYTECNTVLSKVEKEFRRLSSRTWSATAIVSYIRILLGLSSLGTVALVFGGTTPTGHWKGSTPQPSAVSSSSAALAPYPAPSTCERIYAADGPWNTPIGPLPLYDSLSITYTDAISGTFGSDPTQFTYPVYQVDSWTPKQTVAISGYFSDVISNTVIDNHRETSTLVPIPPGAAPSFGSDSQIVFWNAQTGDEWGFSRAVLNADGTWSASSGYHYNTNWSGSPPLVKSKFASRGAGLPFLAGLVRPCEIAKGQIDHALAFAYDSPSELFVFPATKSDGTGNGLPEGARLQLNPDLTDEQIQAWGCTDACLTIAHAMQQYGIIVVDRSRRPKIFVEYEATAHWNSAVTATTISNIPYTEFKVLKLNP